MTVVDQVDGVTIKGCMRRDFFEYQTNKYLAGQGVVIDKVPDFT